MVTITRNGVSLRFDKETSSKGLYILKVQADTNDADYISKTTLLDGEKFSSFLPATIILFEICDRHFYEMPRLVSFFGSEYDLCYLLDIPSGTCDIDAHSVSSVEVTYFEDGKLYTFNPSDIPEEKRKELVFNYLVNEVDTFDELEFDSSDDDFFDDEAENDDEEEALDKETAARQVIEEIFGECD